MPTCDSCGKECAAEELQEFKMFGQKSLVCKDCRRLQKEQRGY